MFAIAFLCLFAISGTSLRTAQAAGAKAVTPRRISPIPGTVLGTLDFDKYCRAHGYTGRDKYQCTSKEGNVLIDFNDACAFQFHGGLAIAANPAVCIAELPPTPVQSPRTLSADSGIYQPGNPGVTMPVPTVIATPMFSLAGMRAHISGMVRVQCVVRTEGVCDDITVVHSLDAGQYGLDQIAVETVRAWQFKPGMRLGTPVPVLVSIEVQFSFR